MMIWLILWWIGNLFIMLCPGYPDFGGIIFGVMFWVLACLIPFMEDCRKSQDVIYDIDLSSRG